MGIAHFDEAPHREHDLGHLARLPGEPATLEHVEDLLLAAVLVRRRRPSPDRQLDSPYPDVDAAGGVPGVPPVAAQMPQVDVAHGDLVEVSYPHQWDFRARADRYGRCRICADSQGWRRICALGWASK